MIRGETNKQALMIESQSKTLVYVPILETIKFMCRSSEMCELLVYQKQSDVKTFVMGVILRNTHCSLNNRLLYKFRCTMTTSKLLGSKRGVHQTGALCFVLRNLPPKLTSAVMNVHLVALFHTEDVNKCGFGPILQPLINDIKHWRVGALIGPSPLKQSLVLYAR